MNEPRRFFTDEAKIPYAASLLSGNACSMLPFLLDKRGKLMYTNWEEFLGEINRVFADPDPRTTSITKLAYIKQTGPANFYALEFEDLTHKSESAEAVKQAFLRAGLKPEIRRVLFDDPLPEKFWNLFSKIRLIESRLSHSKALTSKARRGR